MAKKAAKASTANEAGVSAAAASTVKSEEVRQLAWQRLEEIIRNPDLDEAIHLKACMLWNRLTRFTHRTHHQNDQKPISEIVMEAMIREVGRLSDKELQEFQTALEQDDEEKLLEMVDALVERSRSTGATTSKAANKKKRPKK